MKYLVFIFSVIFSVSVFGQSATNSSSNPFVVVLDAGHGGKDPGSLKHGFVEKEIALKVALEVGRIFEKHKDIKVITFVNNLELYSMYDAIKQLVHSL